MSFSSDRTRSVCGRRAFLSGVAGSLLIHALALLVPIGGGDVGAGRLADDVRHALSLPGLRVIRLAEVSPPPPPPAEAVSVPDPDAAPATATAVRRSATSASSPAAAPSLSPSLTDARLFRAARPPAGARDLGLETDELRYRIASATAKAGRPRDDPAGTATWTVAKSDDGAWGASPGGLHVGSVRVPTCGGTGGNLADCGFGIPTGRRDAYREWSLRYADIQRQVRRAAVEAVWEERSAAIRARRDTGADTARSNRR